MLISFDEIIEITLHHEGGYVHDPKDLGGETNYGIAKRFYPDVDIKNLTKEEAKEEDEAEATHEEDHEAMEEDKKAEDEEKKTAKANATITPVATNIRNTKKLNSFKAKWEQAINEYVQKSGTTRQRAIKMVNQNYPGLREQVINESRINQTRNVAV